MPARRPATGIPGVPTRPGPPTAGSLVVTVDDHATDGIEVRWHTDRHHATNGTPFMTVTHRGVRTHGGTSLGDIPDRLVRTATDTHRALQAGADVSHLATRLDGGNGEPDPGGAG